MKNRFYYPKTLVLVLLVGLMLSTNACSRLGTYSSTAPKTDNCKDVPKYVWGEKGALRPEAFDLANCYDWIIQRK